MDGILRVDKSGGATSHDVVARVRRATGQGAVGHAGTLDPMATGLLVVMLGVATRLSSWLTADRKRYLATVRFGATTDTLDADGTMIATATIGNPSRRAVEDALQGMVGEQLQVPPAVSAIKVGGVAMHARVRRGEEVELAPRRVQLFAARVTDHRDGACDLAIECSKGFYVRSLARDLAAALGTLGYLSVLRRTASGPFVVEGALPAELLAVAARGDAAAQEALRRAVEPVEAASSLRPLVVGRDVARELAFGRRVRVRDAPEGTVLVLVEGEAVCVGVVEAGTLAVKRSLRGR